MILSEYYRLMNIFLPQNIYPIVSFFSRIFILSRLYSSGNFPHYKIFPLPCYPLSSILSSRVFFPPKYSTQNLQLQVGYISLVFEFFIPVICYSLSFIIDMLIFYFNLLFELFGILWFLYLICYFNLLF